MASEPYLAPERPELLESPDYFRNKELLLRKWNRAYLRSCVAGFPDVTFTSDSPKWSIYRSGEFRRLRADPTPVETRVPVLAKVEQITVEGRDIMTITQIAKPARISVNDRSLKLNLPFPLSENAIVLIDGLRYMYRSLDKIEAPSHAPLYGIIESQMKNGNQGVVARAAIRVGQGASMSCAVAVKHVTVGRADVDRAAMQLSVWKSFSHPNITPFVHWYAEGNQGVEEKQGIKAFIQICVVTPVAPQGDLHQYIQRHGSLYPEFARLVVKQIIDGLEYIHCRGVFHRDVNPANVLVFGNTPEAITVKLCDFSNSVLKPKDDERRYPQTGTAAWAPPEVLNNHYNASSEAFGVGAILFYVLFAKEPFKIPQSHARATFEQQIWARKSRIDKVNMEDIKEPGNPHSAEELLRGLLKESYAERTTLVSARNDPWMINNRLLDMLSYNDPLVANLLSQQNVETEQVSMENSSVSDVESYQSTERDHVSDNISNRSGDADDNEPDSYQSTERDASGNSDEDHSEAKENDANDQTLVPEEANADRYRGRHYHGECNIPGNLVVSGNLVVRGDVLVTGNVKLNGDMDVVGDVDVQGKLDVGQDVIVDGEAIMKSSVDVRGRMRVRGVDVPNDSVPGNASERGSSADAEGETDYDAESDGGAAIDEAGQDRPWTRSVTPQSDLSRDATPWSGDGVAAPVPDWGYVHDALAARSQVPKAEVDVRSEGTIVAGPSGLPQDPLSHVPPVPVATDVDMDERPARPGQDMDASRADVSPITGVAGLATSPADKPPRRSARQAAHAQAVGNDAAEDSEGETAGTDNKRSKSTRPGAYKKFKTGKE